jgi:hypothetical protein
MDPERLRPRDTKFIKINLHHSKTAMALICCKLAM